MYAARKVPSTPTRVPVRGAPPLCVATGIVPVRVESARVHQGRWLLTLDRIGDRTGAEQHAGSYLVIPAAEAEAARAEGEWFLHALVGRAVVSNGEPLGRVLDVPDVEARRVALPVGEGRQ